MKFSKRRSYSVGYVSVILYCTRFAAFYLWRFSPDSAQRLSPCTKHLQIYKRLRFCKYSFAPSHRKFDFVGRIFRLCFAIVAIRIQELIFLSGLRGQRVRIFAARWPHRIQTTSLIAGPVIGWRASPGIRRSVLSARTTLLRLSSAEMYISSSIVGYDRNDPTGTLPVLYEARFS